MKTEDGKWKMEGGRRPGRDDCGRTPSQAALLEYGEVHLAQSAAEVCRHCDHLQPDCPYCLLRGETLVDRDQWTCRAFSRSVRPAASLKTPDSRRDAGSTLPASRRLYLGRHVGYLGLAVLAWLVKRLVFWPVLLALDAALWVIAGREYRTLEVWQGYRRQTRQALFGPKGGGR